MVLKCNAPTAFPKINYISDQNIVSFRFNRNKSVDSDIQGNVVIDYDKNGRVVNIDVMNINLANFVPVKKMKEMSIVMNKKLTR